jgi:hypothetical protein
VGALHIQPSERRRIYVEWSSLRCERHILLVAGRPLYCWKNCKVVAKTHDISQLPCDPIVPHGLVLAIQAFKGSNHWGNG